MRAIALLVAALLATAAAAAEPPATAKPEQKPKTLQFVMMPKSLWLRALEVIDAQQAEIERLRVEAGNRNACREGI